MKSLLLAAALSFGLSGACLAQTSMPSSNSSAHSQPATASNGPNGQPCNLTKALSGANSRRAVPATVTAAPRNARPTRAARIATPAAQSPGAADRVFA